LVLAFALLSIILVISVKSVPRISCANVRMLVYIARDAESQHSY
jgi:hypothetical protein